MSGRKNGADEEVIEGLTPEEQLIFERLYQQRVDQAGAGGSDEAELRVAKEVLAATIADGLTPTADGGESFVRRGGVDWSDPTMMAAARDEIGSGRGGSKASAGGKNEMLQGVLILLAAVIAGGYFLFFSGDKAEEDAVVATVDMTTVVTEQPGVADGITGLAATVTPVATLESEMLADVVDSSGVKTGLVVPRTLEINGVSFIVQPIQITAGDWQLPLEERAVSWVYGTVINYVIGVEATEDNKNLLASLEPGDELLVRMSTGDVYRFAYADAVRVAPQASEIFRQNRPGVTLVLLGDMAQETRVVIRANYLPESDFGFTEQLPEIQATLGERVALEGSIYVTCLEARLLPDAEAPPGYLWQAVQYQVENQGGEEVATGPFKNQIEADGVSYPIIAVPHEMNPTPDMPPTLKPGQVFSTTAIYAIPETALTNGIAWEFMPGPSGVKARVPLPAYTGAMAPAVQIPGAVLTDDGVLQVSVEVQAGLREVVLEADDFSLKGARLNLEPDANHFPWQVSPGDTGTFTLRLLPDEGVRVVQVIVLEQGFELAY